VGRVIILRHGEFCLFYHGDVHEIMCYYLPFRYYCSLDGSQQRIDKFSRPELYQGSIDFAVTDDYCVAVPQVPEPSFIPPAPYPL
jgi:hypothetical protein